MDDRETRLARNEAMFRDVNERIAAEGERWRLDADAGHDYICECSSGTCAVHVRLTRAAYEAVRQSPERFIVVRGHEHPEIENVVEDDGSYLVVEKTGDARRLVTELDPRAGS